MFHSKFDERSGRQHPAKDAEEKVLKSEIAAFHGLERMLSSNVRRAMAQLTDVEHQVCSGGGYEFRTGQNRRGLVASSTPVD